MNGHLDEEAEMGVMVPESSTANAMVLQVAVQLEDMDSHLVKRT